MTGPAAAPGSGPSGAGHLEREAKLDVDPDLALPDLAGALGGLVAAPLEPRQLDATYFDAADRRLLGAGITVRRRTGEGTRWTVKRPATTPDAAAPIATEVARREVDVFDPALAPPAAVVELVEPWLAGAELVAVARLRSRRRRLALGFDPAGADPVAELDDDVVTVEAGDGSGPRHPVRFREVEVELRASGPEADEVLEAVVGRLLASGARPAPSSSKLARALDLLAAGDR